MVQEVSDKELITVTIDRCKLKKQMAVMKMKCLII